MGEDREVMQSDTQCQGVRPRDRLGGAAQSGECHTEDVPVRSILGDVTGLSVS